MLLARERKTVPWHINQIRKSFRHGVERDLCVSPGLSDTFAITLRPVRTFNRAARRSTTRTPSHLYFDSRRETHRSWHRRRRRFHLKASPILRVLLTILLRLFDRLSFDVPIWPSPVWSLPRSTGICLIVL